MQRGWVGGRGCFHSSRRNVKGEQFAGERGRRRRRLPARAYMASDAGARKLGIHAPSSNREAPASQCCAQPRSSSRSSAWRTRLQPSLQPALSSRPAVRRRSTAFLIKRHRGAAHPADRRGGGKDDDMVVLQSRHWREKIAVAALTIGIGAYVVQTGALSGSWLHIFQKAAKKAIGERISGAIAASQCSR